MKLSTLEPLPSFALLGPGYADGALSLLTDLRRTNTSPQLVYCPYESPGSAPLGYSAVHSPSTLELESPGSLTLELDSRGYREAIDELRGAIAQGDVYQVNFTLRARLAQSSGAALANILCRRGIPSYFAWVRFPGGGEFVSASPECLFATDGRQVRCEPMKGTAAPGQERWLRESEKNRAELAMITDLMRNDLIPVCESQSVHVRCERRFIHLPYAIQTVSDVAGRLLPGLTPLDVLAALHPGGSVTGAPKRAAMHKIAALEKTPRGAYCGALGLLRGDRSRFSLLIRTAEKQLDGWSYGVGGGITWQSNADDELAELELKLGALR